MLSRGGRLVVIAMAAVVSACGTAASANTATPTAAPGQQVYGDTFTSASSGWPTQQKDDHTLGYTTIGGSGAYEIRSLTAGSSVTVSSPNDGLPHRLRVDVSVSVSNSDGGAGGGDAGVGCDYGGDGYMVVLQAGGAFVLEKLSGGLVAATLATGTPGATAAIVAAPGVNQVSLTCAPANGLVTVTVEVNGVRISSVSDNATTPGAAAHVQVWFQGAAEGSPSRARFSALRVFAA